MKTWFNGVDNNTRNILTFYNRPIDPSELEALFQNMTIGKGTYNVIKLDIDNTDLELKVLDVIERNAHAVSELFFEYHFYFDGLDFGWGKLENVKRIHNVTTALRTFTRLREKGIRAHFWT